MERSYKTVKVEEEKQVAVYTFKAADLQSVEVDGFTASFDFGTEVVEIVGDQAELLSVKALIDDAASRARGIY